MCLRPPFRRPEPRLVIGRAELPSTSDDPEQPQDEKNHGNDDQRVDDAARSRDAGTVPGAQKSKKPQDYQDYDDCPDHVSPLNKLDE